MVLDPKSRYHGGYFKGIMKFPDNYPFAPPSKFFFSQLFSRLLVFLLLSSQLTNVFYEEFRFVRPLFHPNIYPDGHLCISILHAPGEDELSGESAAERWSSAQNVESILISILSLLDDAEVSSSANPDAGVMLRKNPNQYDERVKQDVDKSKLDIPQGFQMPTVDRIMEHAARKREMEAAANNDDGFWLDDDDDSISQVLGGDSDDEDAPVADSDTEAAADDDDDGDAGKPTETAKTDANIAGKNAGADGAEGKPSPAESKRVTSGGSTVQGKERS